MTRSSARRAIRIVNYNPKWVEWFSSLRDRLWPHVRDFAIAVEHVGSTAVAGMAAKPIIDLDIVIPSRNHLQTAVQRLADLGYSHRGTLGIEDRDAFSASLDTPAHHLYVCPQESAALRNHLTLRDHLRRDSADAAKYAALKKELAQRFPKDIDQYVDGKTDFILTILARHGFAFATLGSIRSANQHK